jgi:DNA segregation ATPase FtsK/SpoIIIE-like protein
MEGGATRPTNTILTGSAPNLRLATVVGKSAGAHGRTREVAALLIWTVAVFLVLALASYAGDPPSIDGAASVTPPGENWVGPVGAFAARGLVMLVGVVAWVLPLEMVLIGIPLVRSKPNPATAARFAGDLLLALLAAALVQVGWAGKTAFGTHPASGMIGELFGELARSLFSTIGSFLVGFASLGLILIGRASFSFIALARWIATMGAKSATTTASAAKTVADAWSTARELERDRKEQARVEALPNINDAPRAEATALVLPTDDIDLGDACGSVDFLASEETPTKKKRKKREPKGEIEIVSVATATTTPAESIPSAIEVALEPIQLPLPDPELAEAAADAAAKKARRVRSPKEPTIVDTVAVLEEEAAKELEKIPVRKPEKPTRAAFQLPSLDFLVPIKVDPTLAVDRDKLFATAEKLVQTLAHYGVQGKVEDILPGPTVTTYEVSPAPGTKVSKVAGLADDLALALARTVRIVAPIPGKNRIGFEVPNERRVPVSLRDLVEDRRFQTFDAPLPVVLGRDILGAPVYADLASMPHVIVAGATGAGKSVGLNVMLASLLYRRTPEELRLLMIDPKVVELAPFDRIPHMLLPVVTDMKQASTALKWAVDEMERRYQAFADAGTKNIGTYNAWVKRVISGEIRNPAAKVVLSKDMNGFTDAIRPADGEEGVAPLPEVLPFIVIVVDEFADLMMTQGKEVEASVARLAQKARAAGMHVILATQRPSVDVITGIIKANFPTRIAYRVSQRVDSRTILDEQGAEHLLGRGDMLIKLNGTNETKRVQCPWVSEEEIQIVTDHLRAQGEPVYDDNILKPRDEDGVEEIEDAEQDPLYDDAIRIVIDTRRCSTSWLQRKLGLGYNRAARIVEMMERRGMVGPANGAKDREVLINAI